VDTGSFTDHVFAVTSLLAYRFIPRIRDLPSKRLHVFDPASTPKELKGLIGGRIKENTIIENWLDILSNTTSIVAGIMPPSQLLRKLAPYPHQNELVVALREIGRIECTLFIFDRLLDADMQRRALIGLNKGEAHHALKTLCAVNVSAKSVTEPPRDSTTGWRVSICSPQSLSTGTLSTLDVPWRPENAQVSIVRMCDHVWPETVAVVDGRTAGTGHTLQLQINETCALSLLF
jgi:hypothetical protein